MAWRWAWFHVRCRCLRRPIRDPQSQPNRRVPDVRAGASIACLFGLADRRGDLPGASFLGAAGADWADDARGERGACTRDHGLPAGRRRREHRGPRGAPRRAHVQPLAGLAPTEPRHVYRRTGYFIRALRAWEEAWVIASSAVDPRGKAVADRAVGELAQLHARLGNRERLEQIFTEIEGRDIGGSAGELLVGAKQGLWEMQNQPERAFRCGPLALDRILASVRARLQGHAPNSPVPVDCERYNPPGTPPSRQRTRVAPSGGNPIGCSLRGSRPSPGPLEGRTLRGTHQGGERPLLDSGSDVRRTSSG